MCFVSHLLIIVCVFVFTRCWRCYFVFEFEYMYGSKGSHYCPSEAQVFSIKKRTSARKYRYRIPQERVDFIRLLLESDWSSEQISSVLTRVGAAVSLEWIYRFVAQDKRMGGKLYRHLRQGHKRYRRGRKEKAPSIKNAVSIDERLSIVDSKERLGDWVIGK